MIKKYYLVFILLITLLFLFEILGQILIHKTSLLDRYFFHKHELLNKDSFEEYLLERNEITGWPTKSFENTLSTNLSRNSPANNKYSEKDCFSIYGDSYAFDTEVNDTQAWPNQLAEIMSCGVLNYGIPGYGLDQAYLRFKSHNPKNLNVIMTLLKWTIERARTRMYSLQSGEGINMNLTKPMFELSKNNKLELHHLPINNFKDYQNLNSRMYFESIFYNDLFLPDNDTWSMSVPSFPYTFEMINLFIKLLKRQISYGAYLFYHPTFKFAEIVQLNQLLTSVAEPLPSYRDETIRLNEKILESFINDCKHLGIKCLIAPLPLIMDFGKSKESKIIKSLRANTILSDKLLIIEDRCLIDEYKKVGVKEEEIKLQLAPGRHYNDTSSNVIAKCLFKELNT